MDNKKKLVCCMIKFLKDELGKGQEDESLEVAIQCLENAYEVKPENVEQAESLLAIFNEYQSKKKSVKATPEQKAEAESWKNKGNELLKASKYQEALDCYSRAIELDSSNPMFFCNRAAAHSYLNNHQACIEDCKTALSIDPTYSKAYGRLGLAYSSLNKYKEAKEAYNKALELEPGNATYLNNLELLEEKARSQQNATTNGAAALNMNDFSALFTNPRVMTMASQLISDPSMQSMLNNFVSGNMGNMDGLLQAGQVLAEAMRSSNPELVDQLRTQINRTPQDPSQPPPPNN